MKTLGEDLPKEQVRVREILGHYKEIGPAGVIGGMMIEQSLNESYEAAMSGDVVRMLRSYNDLKNIKG